MFKPEVLIDMVDMHDDVLSEGTFEAPRFYVVRGAELGYHAHVYETIGRRDVGLMLTMADNDVYAERHRVGKVKSGISADDICEKDRRDLVLQTGLELHRIPNQNRRKPQQRAVLIGVFQK